jgi:hypothetical protein
VQWIGAIEADAQMEGALVVLLQGSVPREARLERIRIGARWYEYNVIRKKCGVHITSKAS